MPAAGPGKLEGGMTPRKYTAMGLGAEATN
jgi:hypothetical protein